MHFDLIDLKLFIAVAEAGSMAEAARRENISVSALHERMKLLEGRAGLALTERTVRGTRVTAAGATVLSRAKAVLHQAERLRGSVANLKRQETGTIRLRVNTSALASFLPVVLARFLARYPGIVIDLREDTSDAIVTAARSGAIEIGIAAGSIDVSGTVTHPLLTDRLTVIVPTGHPLAETRSVDFIELLKEDFIGLDEQSAIHHYLTEKTRAIGQTMTVRIRLRSFEGVCRLVAAGAGISIVPKSVLGYAANDGSLVPLRLNENWARRDLVACIPERTEPTDAVRLLLEELTSSARAFSSDDD